MKIIISEKHLKKILVNSDILNEQVEPTSNDKSLIVLQNRINDIIDKKQKDILDKIGIKVTTDREGIKLEIGGKFYPMQPMMKGIYAIVIPPKTTLPFGATPMSELLPEIEKLAEYKTLSEKHPEIKDQISKGVIKGTIFTDEQNQGTFKLTVTRKPRDPGDSKFAVDFGTDYPLGEFLERNKIVYKFKNGTFGTLESGDIQLDLASIDLKVEQPKNVATTQPISIGILSLGDIFNFDSVDFKDQNAAEQQILKFVQNIKTNIEKFGQPFIDHIKSQNPIVYGYASIDGDPNQPITGGYKPCSGHGTRKEYDMCLSNERAKKIAEILNKSIPELAGIFKHKGLGETTQFGPGWTKENPTIPEQTAPNRIYFLNKMQPFVG